MPKYALLVGVSNYRQAPDLQPLPSAVKDVEAFAQVLEDSEIGGFDHVKTLLDEEASVVSSEIEILLNGLCRKELVLLFFSGHGIKDDEGNLYLAVPNTCKDAGTLVRSTAVDAALVRKSMNRCKSQHKIVILDCCFSGAFSEGFLAKDDGTIDIQKNSTCKKSGDMDEDSIQNQPNYVLFMQF